MAHFGTTGGAANIFAPFKPLLWLFLASAVILLIAMVFIGNREGAQMPKPVVIAPDEKLQENLDFDAYEWQGPPGRGVAMDNFQAIHTIQLRIRRHDAKFSRPVTLNLRLPDGNEQPVREPETARYDDVTGTWMRIRGEPSRIPGVYKQVQTQEPGYYALGWFVAPKSGGPTGGGVTETSEIRAPVMRHAGGKWDKVAGFELVITPSRPAIGEFCAAKLSGPLPDGEDLQQHTVRWYTDEKDEADDAPAQVKVVSEDGALAFPVPTDIEGRVHMIVVVMSIEGKIEMRAHTIIDVGSKPSSN
ncbi:MAG: hypothetical protein HUU29_12325 [Planctomycetaceae bacterium]|nr:hypothetical protein [Planctomycetaceae bacterium]